MWIQRRWLGLAFCALTASACRDASPPRDTRPCEELSFELCDLFDEQCQATIYHYSECARGFLGSGMPPVHAISAQDYREELEAAIAPKDDQGPDRNDRMMTTAFQLLDMIRLDVASAQKDDINTQVQNTLAYYSLTDKAVTLIDHGRAPSHAVLVRDHLVLAHEFTHAQQDERYNLLGFLKERFDQSYDSYYAWRSLLEAEANLSEDLVATIDRSLHISPERLRERLLRLAQRQFELSVDPERSYSVSVSNFPYSTAYLAIGELFLSSGLGAIEALYDQPRTSMLDYMRPLALPPVQRIDVRWPLDPDPAPDTLPILDRMGAWVFQTALARNGIDAIGAQTLAQSWRGDSLLIRSNSQGQDVRVSWRIALPDLPAQTLQELATTLQARPRKGQGAHAVWVHEQSLVWVLTQDAAALEAAKAMASEQLQNAPYQAKPALRPLLRRLPPWIEHPSHLCSVARLQ